jgi:translation initiation factor IF-3
MMGVFALDDALEEAKSRGLDLVQINANIDPPLCKVCDYGKYKYSVQKRKNENLKSQAAVVMKEIKLSYNIDGHDRNVREKAAANFFKQGHRVS